MKTISKTPLYFDGQVIGWFTSGLELRAAIEEFIRRNSIDNPVFDLIFSERIKMHFGFSSSYCWLHYINEDKGYYVPKGADTIEGTTYFMYGKHHTEVFLQNCIDCRSAINACVEFISGEMPSTISWVEI